MDKRAILICGLALNWNCCFVFFHLFPSSSLDWEPEMWNRLWSERAREGMRCYGVKCGIMESGWTDYGCAQPAGYVSSGASVLQVGMHAPRKFCIRDRYKLLKIGWRTRVIALREIWIFPILLEAKSFWDEHFFFLPSLRCQNCLAKETPPPQN